MNGSHYEISLQQSEEHSLHTSPGYHGYITHIGPAPINAVHVVTN